MRLISYESNTGPRTAAVTAEGIVDLNRADSALPSCMKQFLALGTAGVDRARLAVASARAVPLAGLRLLPPVPRPEKVICVGLNYRDHARESGMDPPVEPVIFSKLSSAVATDGDPIVLPAVSNEIDYEAELVAVIGKSGRNIPLERAMEHVAGYCCGNDVSARDWQLRKPGGQWMLGKSFDGFAPFGPTLVTADEVPRPGELRIELRLNGQVMQLSSTSEWIFSLEQLVAYVSQACTLASGDVLFTGTPPGVGFARKPPVFLKDGDAVEVEIESLGTLRNSVISGSAVAFK